MTGSSAFGMITGSNSSPNTSKASSDSKSGANQVAMGWPSLRLELERVRSLSANDVANDEASSSANGELGGSSLSTKANNLKTRHQHSVVGYVCWVGE